MLSFFHVLVNVAILWSHTMVEVPLHASIHDYKEIPYAKLLFDDELVYDALMYYEYGAGHTNLNLVKTHVLGSYTVKYRVYFPTYGFSSEQDIVFVVKDLEAPTITSEENLYFEVGMKLPNLNDLIRVSDNYDSPKDLMISIDTSRVNMQHLGIYPVYYEVSDQSLNKAFFTQYVHVVDRTAPIIEQKKEVRLQLGDHFKVNDFFTIKDNYDKVFDIKFLDDSVNYQKVGSYGVTLEVKDQSNNLSSVQFTLEIYDDQGPHIILKTKELTLNYLEDITEADLRALIVEVQDSENELTIDDVEISFYLDTSFLGSYDVFYTVMDRYGKSIETSLKVYVKDLEPPQIILKEEVIVDVFSLEPYLLDYVEISDNFNHFNQLTISQSGKVDMLKVGEYRVILKVIDQAKNEMSLPVIVYVIDHLPPEVMYPKEIIVHDFKKPIYESLLTITDNYDKTFEIEVFDHHIDYGVIGKHEVEISIKDSSHNETRILLNLEIKDFSIPEIMLKTQHVYFEYGSDPIDLKRYIEAVYDQYDQVAIDDVIITDQIEWEKVGVYQVNYELVDESGNRGSAFLYFYVTDTVAPKLEVQQITIQKNQHFNYLDYVAAYDNYDLDITQKVRMHPSYIPTSIPGFYEVIFYVHDSSGNYEEMKIVIKVEDLDTWWDYVIYFGGLVVIIGLGIFFYYFYYKRAKLS